MFYGFNELQILKRFNKHNLIKKTLLYAVSSEIHKNKYVGGAQLKRYASSGLMKEIR